MDTRNKGVPAYYMAKVRDVLSGDDLVIEVDLGFSGLKKVTRARLAGVDTPSCRPGSSSPEAEEVRKQVSHMLQGRSWPIEALKRDGGGGWLITLFYGEDIHCESLNDTLRAKGYTYTR